MTFKTSEVPVSVRMRDVNTVCFTCGADLLLTQVGGYVQHECTM